MHKLVIFVGVLALVYKSEAKRFTRCELVRELKRQGFPKDQIRDWVCLIENESRRFTNRVSRMNSNGSRDYGLFQINDKYWCNNGPTPGKDCNVRCNDLLTEDITVAATCAKKIYNRHKFRAWYGWLNHCQRKLPNIMFC
ncbi:hypothetical protein O3G_MSEX006037 [Manduca sexta]|uniref:Lysozyme n=1 Tax=Manduca sexta TaxID=7130 RepID=A0A921Z234_MANSE|nr:hypothetical protein O3G_MSEX006037 [Manduca sexta]KAG6449380.1 hypothetical protein O3G_MSEX006037 [Manduca sexta]